MNPTPCQPERADQTFHSESAQQAVTWLTLLMSEQVTEQERLAWLAWRQEKPENEAAWRHIDAVCARFSHLNPRAAHQSLSTLKGDAAPMLTRRGVLKALALLSLTGTGVAAGSHSSWWQSFQADYATRVGEQRTLTLEDGTTLLLNTQSAVNVRYDEVLRHVQLVQGEVMIETGQAEKRRPFPRPFIVMTPQGVVQALGTRFSLHSQGERTRVVVFDGKVQLRPQQMQGQMPMVAAGHGCWFSALQCGPTVAIHGEPAWVKGQLLADNQRLADFLDELSRYRHGMIRTAADVADLRVSGVFPLREGEQIFRALETLLPIEIHAFSRYWVQVSARRLT